MSAFIVSDYHINTLASYARSRHLRVYAGKEFSINCSDDPDRVAGILYTANVESVNSRYNEHQLSVGFKYRPVPVMETPVQIIKACNCFDYQACEVPNYESTPAAMIVNAIRREAMRELPGYEDADWQLTDPRQE
jgi:hypothetical protein